MARARLHRRLVNPSGPIAWHPWSALLMLVPLVLVAPRGSRPSPPRMGVELALALLWGFGAALLAHLWLARWTLQGYPLGASDFDQYCDLAVAMANGQWPVGLAREGAGAVLPGLLGRHLGLIEGYAVTAVVSGVVLYGGLYLWGRWLHSRAAGVGAVLVGLALGPLVSLTRTATAYPQAQALTVAGVVGASLAVLSPSWVGPAMAGVGLAGALLLQQRNLLAVLACVPLALLGIALHRRPLWHAACRVGLLLAPLLLAHFAAARLNHPERESLEHQAWSALRHSVEFYDGVGFSVPEPWMADGFLFGHRDGPVHAVRAIRVIAQMGAAMPPPGDADGRRERLQAGSSRPWTSFMLASAALAFAGLWRRPRELLVAGYGAAFFATAWVQAANQDPLSRFLAAGAPGVALLGGLATGALLHTGWDRLPAGYPRLRVGAGLTLLGLAMLGVVPGGLAPHAAWRLPPLREAEPAGAVDAALQERGGGVCAEALRRDRARGLPLWPRWLEPPGP